MNYPTLNSEFDMDEGKLFVPDEIKESIRNLIRSNPSLIKNSGK
ncbi:MAG: hypothetical protein ABIT69_03750 [Sphingomicrobium sp.]